MHTHRHTGFQQPKCPHLLHNEPEQKPHRLISMRVHSLHANTHAWVFTNKHILSRKKKTAAIFLEEMDMTGCGYNHSRQAVEEVGNTNTPTYTLWA